MRTTQARLGVLGAAALMSVAWAVPGFAQPGENRREALKIAAGFRGEEAFQAGVAEDQALDTVLPRLSRERAIELANECIQLYMWDRLGSDN